MFASTSMRYIFKIKLKGVNPNGIFGSLIFLLNPRLSENPPKIHPAKQQHKSSFFLILKWQQCPLDIYEGSNAPGVKKSSHKCSSHRTTTQKSKVP